jgi:AraC-like DNA-binding protein
MIILKKKQRLLAVNKCHQVLESRVQERTAELKHTNEQLCREIDEYKRLEAELKKTVSWLQICLNLTNIEQSVPQSIFPSHPKLRKVFQFIETNYQQSITLSDVAKAVGYSKAYLTDLVRRLTGKTVNHWIRERRITEARYLLLETDQTVKEIAEAVGYQNVGHFFRQFRQCHGTTPQAWRNSQQF